MKRGKRVGSGLLRGGTGRRGKKRGEEKGPLVTNEKKGGARCRERRCEKVTKSPSSFLKGPF